MKRQFTVCLLPILSACSWGNSWAPPNEDDNSGRADAAAGTLDAGSDTNVERDDDGGVPTEPPGTTAVNPGQQGTTDDTETSGSDAPEYTDDGASSSESTTPVVPTSVSEKNTDPSSKVSFRSSSLNSRLRAVNCFVGLSEIL